MAVQQNRKTRSKRDKRRSHHALSGAALTEDSHTGEVHRRHHISPEGVYRGRQVIRGDDDLDDDNEEELTE